MLTPSSRQLTQAHGQKRLTCFSFIYIVEWKPLIRCPYGLLTFYLVTHRRSSSGRLFYTSSFYSTFLYTRLPCVRLSYRWLFHRMLPKDAQHCNGE